MTKKEKNAIFYIMFIIVLGTVLSLFGYTSPNLVEKEHKVTNQERLQELLSQDHIPRYDLNKVTYDELMYIRGIGPSTAIAIVDYQTKTGFKNVDDLLNIRGIGTRRLEEYRQYFFIEGVENKTKSENTPPISNTNTSVKSKPLININTATLEELTTLSGIGPSRATSIIEYRTQHGRFRTIDDIKNIRGIGNVIFDNIKDHITVGN